MAADTARAVFHAVYGYWRSLPKERRPRLYLFGLSLGARNSDLSADFFDIIADPFQGALWAGPPWDNVTWRRVTETRAAGSPVWLPRFCDESLFRFTTQRNALNEAKTSWVRCEWSICNIPPTRSFSSRCTSLWRPPAWMEQPRGPDVSPAIRWMPVVTFVQQICDMMTATTTPRGVGHVYAGAHYLDGWIAVTEPQGWNEQSLARLREVAPPRMTYERNGVGMEATAANCRGYRSGSCERGQIAFQVMPVSSLCGSTTRVVRKTAAVSQRSVANSWAISVPRRRVPRSLRAKSSDVAQG